MKKTITFLLTFSFIIIVSAFLAPYLATFLDFKFHRIFSRCVTVGVIGWALIAFVRADKASLREVFKRYGLKWKRRDSRAAIMQGFFITFGILTALMLLQLVLGARIFHLNIKTKWPLQLIEYTAACFIIAFIEEFFFRGLIFQKLRKWSVFGAVVITNSFYAVVHFLKAPDLVISETPTVYDSFRLIGALLQPLFDPMSLLVGFVGLFIFGLILTYPVHKTGSLYYSIGIHAGAVFFLKIDGFFLNVNHEMPQLLYGDKNVYTGILGWIFMACIHFCMVYFIRRRHSSSEMLDK